MLRLFGGRLLVSPFALVLVLIISFSPDAPFFAIAILCALLHEAAHILAMCCFKVGFLRVAIYPFGADIKLSGCNLSYKADAVCALAGPLMSFLAFLFSLGLFGFFGNAYVLSAVASNFLFFAVNILPVRGLDGGRILLSLLLSRLDYSLAYRIFSAVSGAGFLLLCVLAFALLFASGYNLSLVFICTYLFISEYVRSRMCAV